MALQPLSTSSQIIVYNSDVELKDKTAIGSHQGVPIGDILALGGGGGGGAYLPLTGGTLTGNLNVDADVTVLSTQPTIYLTESDANSDYAIRNNNGIFNIYDNTNLVNRLSIDSNGNTTVSGTVGNASVFTLDYSNLIVQSFSPRISLIDTNNDSDFEIRNDGGVFKIYDSTRAASVFEINSSGKATLDGNLSFDPSGVATYSISMVSTTATSFPAVYFQTTAGTAGSIQVSGTTTAYNTTSDYRLKENITPVVNAIDRVEALNPVQFNFIGQDATVDGFLAHEVQTVIPECITGEKDAVDEDGAPVYQGIDQSKIVPLLAAALKEAIARIKALEAQAGV